MKALKVTLFSFLVVAIATLGTAFKSNVEDSKSEKKFATVSYRFKASVTQFQIGATPSTPISTSSNWESGTAAHGGSTYLSEVLTTYSGAAPGMQSIINAVKARYDANSNSLSDNESWTVGSITYRVFLKD